MHRTPGSQTVMPQETNWNVLIPLWLLFQNGKTLFFWLRLTWARFILPIETAKKQDKTYETTVLRTLKQRKLKSRQAKKKKLGKEEER